MTERDVSFTLKKNPFSFIDTFNFLSFVGIVDCVKKTVARDGPKGLYRGMAAPLVGVTPIFAVCFWGFEVGKQLARKIEGKKAEEHLSVGGILLAGGFSAIPATAVMVPAERVKVLLQVSFFPLFSSFYLFFLLLFFDFFSFILAF